VGDIHGNFHDLLRILATIGNLEQNPVLFLGDYVDRGSYSIDVVLLLLTLKCRHPHKVFLLRGNHEFSSLNAQYGFKEECDARFPETTIYDHFNSVFDYLPFACVLGGNTICIHGGIGPETVSVSEIRRVTLPYSESAPAGIPAELVWGDPENEPICFVASARGRGYQFGTVALTEFLRISNCSKLIRAHQCVQFGILQFAFNKGVTVFSSSNYMGGGNTAGFLQVSADGSLRPLLLEPLTGIPERQDAEFEEAVMIEDNETFGQKLSAASEPTFAALGAIGKAGSRQSLLGLLRSGPIVKPKIGRLERRSSVHNLLVMSSARVEAKPSLMNTISEDESLS
jgi:protein phosphatase